MQNVNPVETASLCDIIYRMTSFESAIQNKQTIEWQKINPDELPAPFAKEVEGEITDGLQVYKWNKREISKQITEYKITGTVLQPQGLFDVTMVATTFDEKIIHQQTTKDLRQEKQDSPSLN